MPRRRDPRESPTAPAEPYLATVRDDRVRPPRRRRPLHGRPGRPHHQLRGRQRRHAERVRAARRRPGRPAPDGAAVVAGDRAQPHVLRRRRRSRAAARTARRPRPRRAQSSRSCSPTTSSTSLFDPADPLAVSPRPAYLDPSGATAWAAEYPDEFRALLPAARRLPALRRRRRAGLARRLLRRRRPAPLRRPRPDRVPRGLLLGVTRPARRGEPRSSTTTHDLLPVRGDRRRSASSARPTYDYRVLQPRTVTDPNGNTSQRHLLAGRVRHRAVRAGQERRGRRTRCRACGMDYDLLAFAERGQPVSVRTIRRVHHDTDTDVPPTGATRRSSGRVLRRVRAAAPDPHPGRGRRCSATRSSAAACSRPTRPQPGRGRRSAGPGRPAIRTTSSSAAGRSTTTRAGWSRSTSRSSPPATTSPRPATPSSASKATMFYDPRGQVDPHGQPGRHRAARRARRAGRPRRPRRLRADAVGVLHLRRQRQRRPHPRRRPPRRTAATGTRRPASRSTPSAVPSSPSPATARPDADWFTTRSTYDIQGNLIAITDALGRRGVPLPLRPGRAPLADRQHRRRPPRHGARRRRQRGRAPRQQGRADAQRLRRAAPPDPAVGPRRRRRPGHAAAADRVRRRRRPRPARRRARRGPRAQPARAGRSRTTTRPALVTVADVDFKGNVLDAARRVIADAPILAVYDAGRGRRLAGRRRSGSTGNPRPARPWPSAPPSCSKPTAYRTTTSYDALNRASCSSYPTDVEGRRRELRPDYNRAGGAGTGARSTTRVYVERIAYDAKGQRTLIAYGNGVMTRYAYDPRHVPADPAAHRALHQPTASPTGRPGSRSRTRLRLRPGRQHPHHPRPHARQRHPQQPGRPDRHRSALGQLLIGGDALDRRFTYDPLYRLRPATGRECDVAARRPAVGRTSPAAPTSPAPAPTPRATATTRSATCSRLDHAGGAAGFTREFTSTPASNRLQRMQVGARPLRLHLRRQRQPDLRDHARATSTGTTPTS